MPPTVIRLASLLLAFLAAPAPAAERGPVIDMHLHAYALELPPGTPACPGDQGILVPTLDPRAELRLLDARRLPRARCSRPRTATRR